MKKQTTFLKITTNEKYDKTYYGCVLEKSADTISIIGVHNNSNKDIDAHTFKIKEIKQELATSDEVKTMFNLAILQAEIDEKEAKSRHIIAERNLSFCIRKFDQFVKD